MTIDFDNEEQYRKFVRDVAASVYDYGCHFELSESIADYVVDELMQWNRRRDLAEAIVKQLLDMYTKETNHENN